MLLTYFSLDGKGVAKIRYCGLSSFLPASENLADTVQKDILSLFIEVPVAQVIRIILIFTITYLSSFSGNKT